MIGPGFADGIGRAIVALIVGAFLAGGVLAALAIWLAPILWGWLKPLIHAATA